MDFYMVLWAVFGIVVLLTAWVPMLLKELPLSLPIVCIVIGALLYLSPLAPIVDANPLANRVVTERLTEFVVVIALMGAGLKMARPVSLRGWGPTWRLLGISMPLTIGAVTLLGWALLGLPLPTALLLGAALAPTDPVLASDVEVGPPGSETEDEVRFALTSEAGLNDGAAFPFVYLAIALAAWFQDRQPFLADWFVYDVLWKIGAAVGIGWLGGKVMGLLMFRLPDRAQISRTGDGFVALGITSLCYGTTQILGGYGFLAVFVAAVALRSVERTHRYHEKLHAFAEQIERLMMMVLLVFFGAALAEGSIFHGISLSVVLTAGLVLFVVRPVCGWIGLIGSPLAPLEKTAIAFFGIRELGSFYYVAFALGQAEFENVPVLGVTVCVVVLASIILHGTTVTPIMRRLDSGRRGLPDDATPRLDPAG